MNELEKENEKSQNQETTPLGLDFKDPRHLPAEYIPAEVNLETIGYFTAGYKRTYPKTPNEARSIALTQERSVRFIPSSFGYPNTEDLDFYRSLLKICEKQTECTETVDEEGRVTFSCVLPQPIHFSTKRLIDYSGRFYGSDERRAVRDFIRRNHATSIHGKMRVRMPGGKIREIEAGTEPWFRRFYLVGDSLDDGTRADRNAVWFAEWFLSNYNNRYLKLIDLNFHQQLGTPIAKSLAPILDSGWCATKGKPWKKRYIDLATLLGVPAKQYISHIKRQLDPSHEELQRSNFLHQWEYEQASDTIGYVITWWPGSKWFNDQRVYEERRQTAQQIANRSLYPTLDKDLSRTSTPPQPRPLSESKQYLADDLIERLEDEHSRKNWEAVVRAGDISADMLRGMTSEAVYASRTGSLKKTKGAYAMDLVKRFRENRKAKRSGGAPSPFPSQLSNAARPAEESGNTGNAANVAKGTGFQSDNNLAANAATDPPNPNDETGAA